VPVEFLSDEEAAAYGRFSGSLSREELERSFFFDDADRVLIARHRGEVQPSRVRVAVDDGPVVGRVLGRSVVLPLTIVSNVEATFEWTQLAKRGAPEAAAWRCRPTVPISSDISCLSESGRIGDEAGAGPLADPLFGKTARPQASGGAAGCADPARTNPGSPTRARP
jgi:hypothetical protein